MIFKKNNWKNIILNGLENNKVREAYLVYFKANARGYATHDEILVLKNEINKQKLKFYTSAFGINDFYFNVKDWEARTNNFGGADYLYWNDRFNFSTNS